MATEYDAPYKVLQRQPPFNIRHVVAGAGEYVIGRCVHVGAKRDAFGKFAGRHVKVTGGRLQRVIPKVRGKAAVKRAKRARQQQRMRDKEQR